ncbi:fatty-acid synthase [Achromatium sp. WMS3]|nr:fatty-acid synthase [Achromatium sp. WMS3]
MPRKDIYHQTVIQALNQEGWIITDDPLRLSYGGRNIYVDLGAKQRDLLGAEKSGRKIAVEIKSFMSESDIHDFEVSLGQYHLYRAILEETEPERTLYLAISLHSYEGIFKEPLGQLMIHKENLNLLIFNTKLQRIKTWIP